MKASFGILTILVLAFAFVSAKDDDKSKCEDIMSAKACKSMEKLGKTLQTSIKDIDAIIKNSVVKGVKKAAMIYKKLLRRYKRAGNSSDADMKAKQEEAKILMDKILADILKEYQNADSQLRKLIRIAVSKANFKRKGVNAAVRRFLKVISGENNKNETKQNLVTKYRRSLDQSLQDIIAMVKTHGKAALSHLLSIVSSGMGQFKTFIENYIKTLNMGTGNRAIRSTDVDDLIADAEVQNELESIAEEAEFEVEASIEGTLMESEQEVEEISDALGHEISRRDLADDVIIKKFEFFLGIFGSIAGPQLHSVAQQLFQTHRQEIVAAVKGGFFAMLNLIPRLLPLIG